MWKFVLVQYDVICNHLESYLVRQYIIFQGLVFRYYYEARATMRSIHSYTARLGNKDGPPIRRRVASRRPAPRRRPPFIKDRNKQ